MSGRTLNREHAIVADLTLALPLWAKPLIPLTKSNELHSPARVGNTGLLAGQYELIMDDKTARFEKDKKVVAEIPYQLIRITKPPMDAMVFHKEELTEIVFAGQSMALEFTDGSASVSPSPSSFGNR